jgi:anti-sigma regulatory factor (Ser/Thr protein kinase)
VLLYSDGVVEAENQALEFFGTERLTALVNDADPGSTQELLDTISQSLHDYTGDYPRSDDVSLLTLGRDPRAVSLTMDADVSRLDELLDLIEAQDHSTSATERYRLQLVASELLTNIIRHGYRGAAGRITSCLTVYPDSLAFEVWDEAPEPFRGTLAPPSEALPAPAGDEEDVADTPEGGYGMQILHTICARVIHEPRTPIGNYWGCFLSRKVT